MINRTFVIGDIHGRYFKMMDVLTKARFSFNRDKLIILGDVCDYGEKTSEVITTLLRIRYKILILGNHDIWFLNYIKNSLDPEIWLSQGGTETLKSYGNHVPIEHERFLSMGKLFYAQGNNLYLHAGFDPSKSVFKQDDYSLFHWDRTLIEIARNKNIQDYENVFVGHTPVSFYSDELKPIQFNNLWMLDCGAKNEDGKVCLFDTTNNFYYLSD